jgi:hypothetical protein
VRFCREASSSPARRRRSRWNKLYLEPLEQRLAPAIAWDGGPTGTDTDWNVAANWVGTVWIADFTFTKVPK